MASSDDSNTSAMVTAVRDMSRNLETFQRHADDERRKLRSAVDATVAAMRKDFWATTAAIQRDAAQHRDEHTAERTERAADLMQRTHRQTTIDIWMGALTVLGLINLALMLYLAFRR